MAAVSVSGTAAAGRLCDAAAAGRSRFCTAGEFVPVALSSGSGAVLKAPLMHQDFQHTVLYRLFWLCLPGTEELIAIMLRWSFWEALSGGTGWKPVLSRLVLNNVEPVSQVLSLGPFLCREESRVLSVLGNADSVAAAHPRFRVLAGFGGEALTPAPCLLGAAELRRPQQLAGCFHWHLVTFVPAAEVSAEGEVVG